MPTSFMLQLKNVQEVVRKGSREPTGVVITQVVNAMVNQCTAVCVVFFEFPLKQLKMAGSCAWGPMENTSWSNGSGFFSSRIMKIIFSLLDWSRRCGRA